MIHNLRIGFATNSSSTHSVVFTREPLIDIDAAGGEFGWGNFVAASREAKLAYLEGTLRANLYSMSAELVDAVVTQWVYDGAAPRHLTDPDILRLPEWERGTPQVDHQSVLLLPRHYGSFSGGDLVSLSRAFFDTLKAYILHERVAILGGNDNDEDPHPEAGLHQALLPRVPRDDRQAHWVCRHDGGTVWTLFNTMNGARIVIDFALPSPPAQEPRPMTPRLVDLKITDRCDVGCGFCYQGSTPKGRHADQVKLSVLMGALRDLEVLEVAIGGGEPTDCPWLWQQLECARWGGGPIINFTTAKMGWLEDTKKFRLAYFGAGSWAFSAHDAAVVRDYGTRLAKAIEVLEASDLSMQERTWMHDRRAVWPERHYPVHVVMGTVTEAQFEEIWVACHELNLALTLLAYKTDGRGQVYSPVPYRWLPQAINRLSQQHGHVPTGFDTPLVAEFTSDLERLGVSPLLYRVAEGFDSCYIDAVSWTLHRASYGDGRAVTHALPPLADDRPGEALAAAVRAAFQRLY